MVSQNATKQQDFLGGFLGGCYAAWGVPGNQPVEFVVDKVTYRLIQLDQDPYSLALADDPEMTDDPKIYLNPSFCAWLTEKEARQEQLTMGILSAIGAAKYPVSPCEAQRYTNQLRKEMLDSAYK